MDVEILSRLQFAGTIMFHYLFPPLTIGLGLIMVIIEGIWLKTRDETWNAAARFWTRIFALNFALGVSTGIVMEFEFGTNWAAYSRFVGDVFGSALAAEGIFAFFLESGFLAVLVFGWDRVGPKMHFFSALMVFLGSCFSAVWIVVANSWQQTPAGYHIVEQVVHGEIMPRAEITDFWAMIFNPSSVDRLTHTLVGAMILGGLFVCSVSAWYLLKGRHEQFARRCFTIGVVVAAVFSLLALVTGHDQAHQVSETQPAKLAAYEGHFETGPADLYLFELLQNAVDEGAMSVRVAAEAWILAYIIRALAAFTTLCTYTYASGIVFLALLLFGFGFYLLEIQLTLHQGRDVVNHNHSHQDKQTDKSPFDYLSLGSFAHWSTPHCLEEHESKVSAIQGRPRQ